MLDWYVRVFNSKVQYQSPVIASVTYGEEHHPLALLNLGIVKGEADARAPRAQPRVGHVALGYCSLAEMRNKYVELKAKGVRSYWCVHHGITLSLYYADPDGNQMEFQVDCFPTVDEANAFMYGPHFEANPIGVEFDPEVPLARLKAGTPEAELLPRREHLPVSEVRGTQMN